MFDLQNNVVEELSVQSLKVIVRSRGPVVFQVAPVHVVVIDKPPVKDQTAMPGEWPGYDIGSVSVAAVVSGGTEPPFGVRLENETAEVRNGAINSINRFLPEIGDAGVKRVEGVESANLLRAAEIDRDKKPYAPGAECFGSNKLRQKAGC